VEEEPDCGMLVGEVLHQLVLRIVHDKVDGGSIVVARGGVRRRLRKRLEMAFY
jgi:hypothetical protein